MKDLDYLNEEFVSIFRFALFFVFSVGNGEDIERLQEVQIVIEKDGTEDEGQRLSESRDW